MIYTLKKGSYGTYVGPNGEKMPRTETVKAQDLVVGDILMILSYGREPTYKSAVVASIEKSLPKKDPNVRYESRLSKEKMYTVTYVFDNGRSESHGPIFKSGSFERQTTEAAWRKEKKEGDILSFRSAVRTLLGTTESSLGLRPTQKYLQTYWDELDSIRERLTTLEREMTVAAGRDPEKDKRKMTDHRGRKRR